jgi:hypothetical protein
MYEFLFCSFLGDLWHKIGITEVIIGHMIDSKKKATGGEEQEWENPQDPELPSDDRDKEQIIRQYKEAKRRKDNLTEKDHIDKEPKDE